MVQHIETKIKFQQIIVFREESEIVDSKKISVSHLPINGVVVGLILQPASFNVCKVAICRMPVLNCLRNLLRQSDHQGEPSQHDSPLSCSLNPSVAS
jgi:hypothetical protein